MEEIVFSSNFPSSPCHHDHHHWYHSKTLTMRQNDDLTKSSYQLSDAPSSKIRKVRNALFLTRVTANRSSIIILSDQINHHLPPSHKLQRHKTEAEKCEFNDRPEAPRHRFDLSYTSVQFPKFMTHFSPTLPPERHKWYLAFVRYTTDPNLFKLH